MKYCIVPATYSGTVAAPASKSFLQRAMVIAALSGGESKIHGYSPSGDTEVILNAVHAMGASASLDGNTLTVFGGINPDVPWDFYCSESGLAARMLSALSLLNSEKVTLTGSGTLMHRPMNMVTGTLESCGKRVISCDHCLPFEITGKAAVSEIRTDGSQTSQFLSGLLIALPFADHDSVIHVSDLKSKPYVELTMDILSRFGLEVVNEQFSCFRIRGRQQAVPAELKAEGDWSGAAFHLVGGAIAGDVTVTGLDLQSRQADKAVLKALRACGASCEISGDAVRVKREKLLGFDFDASDCPDLFPPLAVLAANCSGVSYIRGVGRLFFKESNRAEAIRDEFAKAGVQVDFTDETMRIQGWETRGATVTAYDDHRMAMALAILSLNASAPVVINGMECVRKSYPGFISDFERLKG